jgi:hypothetical protein
VLITLLRERVELVLSIKPRPYAGCTFSKVYFWGLFVSVWPSIIKFPRGERHETPHGVTGCLVFVWLTLYIDP